MAASPPLVLVVDDERPIRKFLHASLCANGYRVVEAANAEEALRQAAQQPPDLVILDLGLPDVDGQEVLATLREWLSAPILILSARGQESQKIQALDAGADDYLTKPFGVGELLARVRVAIRNASRAAGQDSAAVQIGDLTIDLAARRILKKGEEIHLTPIEYRLLTTLARHAGKVLTHRFLLREVWGPDQVYETHYLRVFMASLRRKIEDQPAQPRFLLTEQGVGYRLSDS